MHKPHEGRHTATSHTVQAGRSWQRYKWTSNKDFDVQWLGPCTANLKLHAKSDCGVTMYRYKGWLPSKSPCDRWFQIPMPETEQNADWRKTLLKLFTAGSHLLGRCSRFRTAGLDVDTLCFTLHTRLKWVTVSWTGTSNASSVAWQNDGVYSLVKVVKLILLPRSAHSMRSRKEQQRETVSFRKLFPLPGTTWIPTRKKTDSMTTRLMQTPVIPMSPEWAQYLRSWTHLGHIIFTLKDRSVQIEAISKLGLYQQEMPLCSPLSAVPWEKQCSPQLHTSTHTHT